MPRGEIDIVIVVIKCIYTELSSMALASHESEYLEMRISRVGTIGQVWKRMIDSWVEYCVLRLRLSE